MGQASTRNQGRAALRLIVATGIVLTGFLLLVSSGLKQFVSRNEGQRAGAAPAASPFDGARAWADLERVVAIGPRPSGSPELERLRGLIRAELEKAGLDVREQAFQADTPIGTVKMVNLWGVVEGSRPGVIILGNHYETKYFPDFTFVGANDAGSTTAWMLEMARTTGPRRKGRSLWLAFFDGEEAFNKEWSREDSLYGSRAFVEHLRARHELTDIHAMINVDMIGDRYLGIRRDTGAPAWLTMAIWNRARELGYGAHFLNGTLEVEDDHIPFRLAGIPAVDIIDFEYGGSPYDHKNTWHTPNDTIDKVCQESLQVVGDVIYHALADIDSQLN
ncbi:MAG: M28 family peptidase [Candidatus Hydrogenedentes bacterium]|nr:M28 family peptidase [Candidatus Hydrogenedentota bacterium]